MLGRQSPFVERVDEMLVGDFARLNAELGLDPGVPETNY
jgi:hypothetical protein